MRISAMRGVTAARKWEICRELYEHRGVSLDLISEMAGVTMDSVKKHSEVEKWTALSGAAALQLKLAGAIDSSVDHLVENEIRDADAERRVRNVKMLSGALEALARSEEKMARAAAGRDRNNATDDDAPLDVDGIKRLNNDLRKLVDKIERDRRVEQNGRTAGSDTDKKGNATLAGSGAGSTAP